MTTKALRVLGNLLDICQTSVSTSKFPIKLKGYVYASCIGEALKETPPLEWIKLDAFAAEYFEDFDASTDPNGRKAVIQAFTDKLAKAIFRAYKNPENKLNPGEKVVHMIQGKKRDYFKPVNVLLTKNEEALRIIRAMYVVNAAEIEKVELASFTISSMQLLSLSMTTAFMTLQQRPELADLKPTKEIRTLVEPTDRPQVCKSALQIADEHVEKARKYFDQIRAQRDKAQDQLDKLNDAFSFAQADLDTAIRKAELAQKNDKQMEVLKNRLQIPSEEIIARALAKYAEIENTPDLDETMPAHTSAVHVSSLNPQYIINEQSEAAKTSGEHSVTVSDTSDRQQETTPIVTQSTKKQASKLNEKKAGQKKGTIVGKAIKAIGETTKPNKGQGAKRRANVGTKSKPSKTAKLDTQNTIRELFGNDDVPIVPEVQNEVIVLSDDDIVQAEGEGPTPTSSDYFSAFIKDNVEPDEDISAVLQENVLNTNPGVKAHFEAVVSTTYGLEKQAVEIAKTADPNLRVLLYAA